MNNALFHLKHLKSHHGLLKAGPTGSIKQGTEVVQISQTQVMQCRGTLGFPHLSDTGGIQKRGPCLVPSTKLAGEMLKKK